MAAKVLVRTLWKSDIKWAHTLFWDHSLTCSFAEFFILSRKKSFNSNFFLRDFFFWQAQKRAERARLLHFTRNVCNDSQIHMVERNWIESEKKIMKKDATTQKSKHVQQSKKERIAGLFCGRRFSSGKKCSPMKCTGSRAIFVQFRGHTHIHRGYIYGEQPI